MKVASLILIWWLPVLHGGGPGDVRCPKCAAHGAVSGSHVATASMERAGDALPGIPAQRCPGLYVEEKEEDPVEDGLVAVAPWISGWSFDPRHGELAPLRHGPENLLRIPPSPHPLRC